MNNINTRKPGLFAAMRSQVRIEHLSYKTEKSYNNFVKSSEKSIPVGEIPKLNYELKTSRVYNREFLEGGITDWKNILKPFVVLGN